MPVGEILGGDPEEKKDMTRYTFVADIINKNWFQKINNKHQREWTFYDDIRALSKVQLKDLLFILFGCLGMKIENGVVDNILESLVLGKAYKLNDITVNYDLLSKLLLCVTLSEYRIDALLLHPPKMRSKEIRYISQSVGLGIDTLTKVYQNWHAGVREKVFGKTISD